MTLRLILSCLLFLYQCLPDVIVVRKAKVAAGGPTELASDAFNRTNETPLASPWVTGTSDGGFNLTSNVVVPVDTGSDSSAYYSGPTWTTNQYAQVNITITATGGNGTGCGLSLRHSTSARTYYRAVITNDTSNNLEVGRMSAGSFTSLALRTATFASGNTFRIEVTGSSTTTIKVFINGSQSGADITDSTSPITASDPAGLAYSSTETCSMDNWSAGSL